MMSTQYLAVTSTYSGTFVYEFNSFQDRARKPIYSYSKTNFPIEINEVPFNSFQTPQKLKKSYTVRLRVTSVSSYVKLVVTKSTIRQFRIRKIKIYKS